MDPRTRSGILLAFAAYAGWGLLSPVGKILLEATTPMWVNVLRMALATAALSALWFRHVPDGLRLCRRPWVVLVALVGNGLSFSLFLYAVERLPATYATLGFYTAPLWTAIIARVALGERVGWAFAPAVVALFVGGWYALGGASGGADPLGLVLAVGSAIGWALYAVMLRQSSDIPARPFLIAQFLIGTIYFLGGAVATEPLPNLDEVRWPWMLLYVAIPTLGTLLLFNEALRRAPASLVNILVGVELAATVVFSMLLLGDRFTLMQAAGIGLVLAAVTAYLAWRERPIQTLSGSPEPGRPGQGD